MGRYRLLVVEDDLGVRKMLCRYLEYLNYDVEIANSAGEALRHLEGQSFDLVLTDLQLPGASGIEVLSWVTVHRQETAVVIVSGCDDARLAVEAMKGGALDYVVKPFQLGSLGETLAKAIAKKKELVDRSRYLNELEASLEQQSGALRATLAQLQESSQGTLEALAAALDARERETFAHSKRVSEYSVHLARSMHASGDQIETIRQGSILHDIGKIGIPDRILLKPDALTAEEWVEMRKHPAIGAWIVNGVESLKPASGIVLAHHERYDGKGYPLGLRGDEIPFGARVFAVADTLDAMLSDRPYRTGQSYMQARAEIENNAGTQFDPMVTDTFLRIPLDEWDVIRTRSVAKSAEAVQA